MDCNCNQRSAGSCRPQMPPPCMDTNCGCGSSMPMPPIQPRMGEQGRQSFPSFGPSCDMMSDMTPPSALSQAGNRTSGFQPSMPQCTIEKANKPIAMAYVPWQQWRQTYPMDKALSRGTIFPELDLPFVMGRCR